MPYNSTEQLTQLDTEDYILITMYGVIFFVGVFGNATVIYVFKFKYGETLTTVQTLIYYLAVSDLSGSIINPFLFIYWQITSHKKWNFGGVGCKILPSLTRLTTAISFSIILIITIDRCRVICQPFKNNFSKRKIRIALFGCFTLAVVAEIPAITYQKVVEKATCQVPFASVPGYAYPYILYLAARDSTFALVFLFANYFTYRELYKAKRDENEPLQNSILEKRNIFKTLVTMSVIFMVVLFPRDIFHIVYTSSWLFPPGIKQTKILLDVNTSLKVLHLSNGIYNIFIYARLHSQFRRRLLDKRSPIQNEIC